MIRIVIQGTHIYGSTDVPITSGTVGREVEFTFDSRWDGLIKTAVFKCGDEARDVYLGSDTKCLLPWEILTEENVGKMITVGVCGMRDNEIVYPTIYTNIDRLFMGAAVVEEPATEHTPELVEQLITVASRAEEVAVHPPIIGENENWWCWDVDLRQYVDTGYRIDAPGDIPGKITEEGGEIFNDPTNQATGKFSHAEGGCRPNDELLGAWEFNNQLSADRISVICNFACDGVAYTGLWTSKNGAGVDVYYIPQSTGASSGVYYANSGLWQMLTSII